MLFRGDYNEKREFARMVIECPARLSVEGRGESLIAVVKDLSATGLLLGSAEPLAVGTQMMVEVTPAKAIVPPLQARAEVVRCSEVDGGGYQLGLQILEMLPGL